MKKLLVSVAFVALTSSSAFAGGPPPVMGGIMLSKSPVTFNGSQSTGTNTIWSSINTTQTNNSPATAVAVNANVSLGGMNKHKNNNPCCGGTISGGSSPVAIASTWTTQTQNTTNTVAISNVLQQGFFTSP